MSKLYITENEKRRIMSLYEVVGQKLPADRLNSQMGQITKTIASQLNNYYKLNLSSAKDGDWWNKEYNDAVARFLKEKGYNVKYCKKGDKLCAEGDDGVVYPDPWVKIETLFNTKTNSGSTLANSGTTQTTQGKINTTHDKNFDYQFYNNKYWFKGKSNTPNGTKYPKWVEATGKGLESIKKNVKFT